MSFVNFLFAFMPIWWAFAGFFCLDSISDLRRADVLEKRHYWPLCGLGALSYVLQLWTFNNLEQSATLTLWLYLVTGCAFACFVMIASQQRIIRKNLTSREIFILLVGGQFGFPTVIAALPQFLIMIGQAG